MSEFFVQRGRDGLMPFSAEDSAQIAKLAYGKPIKIKATVPRNGRFLALYWVLCARVADALGISPEVVSDLIKVATGHCTVVKTKTKGVQYFPRSISFAKMKDEDSFRDFFDRAICVICNEWGMERTDVLAAVEDILVPTELRGR